MRKPGKQKKYTTMKKREARNFYIYTAPWLIGFLVLTLYPILYSFYLMFTNMNLTGIGEFVGLDNWKYAFTDDTLFRRAFLNTLKYVFMFVPCSIILAFFCCTSSEQESKRSGIFPYRILYTIYYLRGCGDHTLGMDLPERFWNYQLHIIPCGIERAKLAGGQKCSHDLHCDPVIMDHRK